MIRLDREGPLWTVTLDRPDKANSLTGDMLRRLADIAAEAAEAPDLRALILTGAGEKVFSAGADLEEAHAGLATAPVWEEVSGNLAALECLTIAALNGTLAAPGARCLRMKAGRAFPDPGDEFREPRMRPERRDAGIGPCQLGLCQGGVDLVVADLVQQNHGPALAATELRDQVVQALPRLRGDRPVAERTDRRAFLGHGPLLPGRGRGATGWGPPGRGQGERWPRKSTRW
jgi:hypothetical protein